MPRSWLTLWACRVLGASLYQRLADAKKVRIPRRDGQGQGRQGLRLLQVLTMYVPCSLTGAGEEKLDRGHTFVGWTGTYDPGLDYQLNYYTRPIQAQCGRTAGD